MSITVTPTSPTPEERAALPPVPQRVVRIQPPLNPWERRPQ